MYFAGPLMASPIKRKLISLDPEATESHITRLHFLYGEETIYVEAVVDDFQLVRHQTMLEPAEYGPAICCTSLLWGEDVTVDNEPSIEEIDELVGSLDISSWTLVNQEDV
jgi:hypothetical protein